MLSIKIIYFVLFGGFGAIVPYLPVFYHQSGMSAAFIGIVGAVVPAMNFFMSPVWGLIADRWLVHREVMAFTLVVSVGLCVGQLVVRSEPLLLAGMVVLYAIFNSGYTPIVEHGVLEALPGGAQDYGPHRLWGAIGFGLSTALAGYIITIPGIGFSGAFAQFSLLVLSGLALVLRYLPLRHSRPPKAHPSDPSLDREDLHHCHSDSTAPAPKPGVAGAFQILAGSSEAALFFLVVFILGCVSGVIERFLFVYLEELGGSTTVMGISRMITCAAEVPFFHYSDRLINSLGVQGVLMLTCLCYMARLLYYSLLTQPWAVLPAELLHGVTFAAMWAASVLQAQRLAPPGMGATAQGLLEGVHWGLGISVGSLTAGYLYSTFGPIVTFRIGAGGAGFALLLIVLYRIVMPVTLEKVLPTLNSEQRSKYVQIKENEGEHIELLTVMETNDIDIPQDGENVACHGEEFSTDPATILLNVKETEHNGEFTDFSLQQ